jgi:hypothetical protein
MDSAIIESQAMQLPDNERALLADKLLSSISNTPKEITEAWVHESKVRLEAFRRGEIEAVDGSSAMASLRENLSR